MVAIDDLALVVDAADAQHLGAVARARHVSQSTVSRSIQRVEAALGRTLFVREGRTDQYDEAERTKWQMSQHFISPEGWSHPSTIIGNRCVVISLRGPIVDESLRDSKIPVTA